VPLETKKNGQKERILEKLGLGEKTREMGVKPGNGTGGGDGWCSGCGYSDAVEVMGDVF
jgi:hypothetical protein